VVANLTVNSTFFEVNVVIVYKEKVLMEESFAVKSDHTHNWGAVCKAFAVA